MYWLISRVAEARLPSKASLWRRWFPVCLRAAACNCVQLAQLARPGPRPRELLRDEGPARRRRVTHAAVSAGTMARAPHAAVPAVHVVEDTLPVSSIPNPHARDSRAWGKPHGLNRRICKPRHVVTTVSARLGCVLKSPWASGSLVRKPTIRN